KQRLSDLGRKLATTAILGVNAPRREEVSEAVQPISLFRHTNRLHDWLQAAQHILVVFYRARRRREDKIMLTLQTGEVPFLQREDQFRSEWNSASASLTLGRTDLIPAIRTLANVKLAMLQIDIGPAQTAQF